MKKKKVSIKKVEKMEEQTKCANCRYFLPVDEKYGYCLKRIAKTAKTFSCPHRKHGYPITELTDEQKAKLLERYISFEIYAKSVQETLKTLKEIMTIIFKDGETLGNRRIVNKTIKRSLLNTKTARKILEEIGRLDECVYETEQRYFRIIDLKDQEK